MTDTFDGLGVGLGALQETAVTAQDLIERVAGQVQKSLRGVDNGVVGQGRVGDDKVLLGRLQGLDERKVGIVQDLVGSTLRVGDQGRLVGFVLRFGVEKLLCLGVAQVRPDGVTKLFVFFLQEGHTLLKRFQEELLANAAALGVFTITFPTFRLLLLTHFTIAGTRRLLLGHGILQVMSFLGRLFVGHGLGLRHARSGVTHD
mmetsp:Transcript_22191/g.35768  ORF Transcript_22191/g.35768 Transcript_22191/m.35768 type:complete len:202 (-) Transcript_22191:473-1078(-)